MTAWIAYPLLSVIGMLGSAYVFERVLGRESARHVPGWEVIFSGALIGMAAGAMLGYALAEGVWTARAAPSTAAFWLAVFGGKTVTGGLLGAYLGVELAKRRVGHTAPTGDTFAVIAPLSLMLGRVGCLIGGCCTGIAMQPAWFTIADAHGVAHWPAAWVEFGFNAVFFAFAVAWTRQRRTARQDGLSGQLFHIYLIAYGVFRFAHEWVRETPRVVAGLSGYQVLSVALVLLGAVRFVQRSAAAIAVGAPGTPP